MAQKSRRYAVVIYACLLITVILVGVMLFSDESGTEVAEKTTSVSSAYITLPTTTEQTTDTSRTGDTSTVARMVIRWTNQQLKEVLTDSLETLESAAKIDEVDLEAPDRIAVIGIMSKEDIAKLLQNGEESVNAAVEMALKLAPQTISLQIDCTAAVSDGSIILTPTALSIEGIKIPGAVLPEAWVDSLNEGMREALNKQQCTVLEISISEDILYLDCEIGV